MHNSGSSNWYLDMKAHGVSKWRADYSIRLPELAYQRLLRKVEGCSGTRFGRLYRLFLRLRLKRMSIRTGISVPPGVFAGGLSIAHYGSVIVNRKARVGSFCRLHGSTNIGEYRGQAPILGDYVYVGPGAVLYGGIRIGDGVVIGANSVVNSDVPENVTVAGAPARIISSRDSSSLMPTTFPPRA